LAEGSGRSARIGLVVLAGAALVVGLALARGWLGGDRRPVDRIAASEPAAHPPGTMGADLPAPVAADPDAPLPEGFLGPLLGPPKEGPRAEFCDEEHWSRVNWLVREIRDGELVVDEEAWARQSASARVGIARWVSRCHFEGGAVRVVGAASGRALAAFPGQPGA
jgi:hypothetical protein